MTSGQQPDGGPEGTSVMYFEATKLARSKLDGEHPLPQDFIGFAQDVAGTLRGYYTFFEEVSEPPDPMLIRRHMVNEMDHLRVIRRAMLDDLNQYFTDEKIKGILPSAESRTEVRNTWIDELDATRKAVTVDLREAVWGALDDLSNEQVPSQR